MSIGATLAEARQGAGLTVAEVSARTRIRASLIQAIEQDEFTGCGGDFYARGHIRAFAAAVGADPGALIGEYDAAHPSNRATLDDMFGPPQRARHGRGPGRWLVPAGMLCCLVATVFIAYRLTGQTGSSAPAKALAASGRATARDPATARAPRPRHATTPRQDRSPPAPTTVPLTQLKPVSAAPFGPGGTPDGDNPQSASYALSGDPATPWLTDWYTTARFGNLKAGTGLLLDLGRAVTATGVTIHLGATPGADLEIRAGATPANLRVMARAAHAGGVLRLRLASHPHVRYVLIWFTLLPPDAAGTYQAAISNVTVTALAR